MQRQIAAILTVLGIVLVVPAESAVMKYFDDQGRLWYVNRIEAIPQKYRQSTSASNSTAAPSNSRTHSPVPSHGVDPVAPQVNSSAEPAIEKKDVEIFVTSWCPYCKKLEKFLDEKSITYKKYDVEQDPTARSKYNQLKTSEGVPVIKIGSKVLQGFDPAQVLDALGR